MRACNPGQMMIVAMAALLMVSCGTLPEVSNKPVSKALATPKSGPLLDTSRRLAQGRSQSHSSVLLLEGNKEALEWRLALVDSARSSIDIQVYLWHSGAASGVLFDRLLRAADRGVRVRLLVDDFLFGDTDSDIATICRHHPNLDIRLFNPRKQRGNALNKAAGFLANFNKLNRRMHNKTWTVDRCMAIVGGRNVADHYYGLDPHYNFVDFDVLTSGPVVTDVSDGFDEYWNSPDAYPGEMLATPGTADDLKRLRSELSARVRDSEPLLQSFPIEPKNWSSELAGLRRSMSRGRVAFVQDRADPKKDDRHTVNTLRAMTMKQEKELILISPYLIPSEQGLANLAKTTAKGIKVGILTPSLGANNQALVHGHYKKHRKAMLEAGVRLFELRPSLSPSALKYIDTPPVSAERVCGHGKAVVGDRSRCFIGSLNLDPRAMVINTESGLLIDSEALTQELLAYLKIIAQPENSWEVKLGGNGRLIWTAGDEVLTREPKASFGARFLSGVSGLLPIGGQL